MTPAEISKLHPAYRRIAREALSEVRNERAPELPAPETMSVEDLCAEVVGGREAFAVVVADLADLRARLRVIEQDRNYWRYRRAVEAPDALHDLRGCNAVHPTQSKIRCSMVDGQGHGPEHKRITKTGRVTHRWPGR